MMGWSEGDDQIENIATKMGSGFKITDFRRFSRSFLGNKVLENINLCVFVNFRNSKKFRILKLSEFHKFHYLKFKKTF